jgi:hypothetical protein
MVGAAEKISRFTLSVTPRLMHGNVGKERLIFGPKKPVSPAKAGADA